MSNKHNNNANEIATVAAQHFLAYAAKASGVSINIHHCEVKQQAHLHLEITEPNELTKKFIDLIELLSEHLQLSLSSLTQDDQRLTQLIEAGFIYGLLTLLEEELGRSHQSHKLNDLKERKKKVREHIDRMLNQAEYKKLLANYSDIPKVSDLFVEKYLKELDVGLFEGKKPGSNVF